PRLFKPKTVTVVQAPSLRAVGPGQTYSNIAAAMAESKPGDTVEVLSGDYREQVILKSGVTLRSRVAREAILRAAPGMNLPAVLGDGLKDARMTGFKIVADAQA